MSLRCLLNLKLQLTKPATSFPSFEYLIYSPFLKPGFISITLIKLKIEFKMVIIWSYFDSFMFLVVLPSWVNTVL